MFTIDQVILQTRVLSGMEGHGVGNLPWQVPHYDSIDVRIPHNHALPATTESWCFPLPRAKGW